MLLGTVDVWAQSPATASRDDFAQHLTDRLFHLKTDSATVLFSSWKPYRRQEIADLVDRYAGDDRRYEYLKVDNWDFLKGAEFSSRKPLFKKLYRGKRDFYHHQGEGVKLYINPILYYQAGNDSRSNSFLYRNTRGLRINGVIDEKVSFSTQLTENQLRYPAYVRDYQQAFGVIPGLGFWKLLDGDAYDFLFASGHVNFKATKHIDLEFGHDRFFIGNGHRSMILSDFSNNYPYFKIRTKVWKFQYTNLYAQLTADVGFFDGGTLGSSEFPKKFMTMHHLSMDVSKKVNIGLFETIIFSRADSLGNNQFELAYLNPVIFYRVAEQHTGSPDNALLGAEINWKAFKGGAVYGQFIIDEFIFSNVFGDRGNWTNKYGYQVGLKYFDVLGVDQLDLQVEHNFGRPYSYTHDQAFTSYTHYRQPLAHPLGANFSEWLGIVRYRPHERWYFYGKLVTAEYGLDDADSNVGKNILLENTSRDSDDDNFVGQGINTRLLFGEFRASYLLKHNLFIDLTQVVRREDAELDILDRNSTITSLGIRLNIGASKLTF